MQHLPAFFQGPSEPKHIDDSDHEAEVGGKDSRDEGRLGVDEPQGLTAVQFLLNQSRIVFAQPVDGFNQPVGKSLYRLFLADGVFRVFGIDGYSLFHSREWD